MDLLLSPFLPSVFDHGCLLALELIKQLLQLVEGLGQTPSAQQLGDRGATGEEAYKDSLLGVVVLVTRKFRQGAIDNGALFVVQTLHDDVNSFHEPALQSSPLRSAWCCPAD